MIITDVQTITIPVADQERALAFYRDTLGLEVRSDNDFGGYRWLTVAPAGSTVEFILHPQYPGLEPGAVQGLVLGTADAAATCERLRTSGAVVTEPEQVPWGMQATFSDLDGNGFVLLQAG